MFTLVIIKFAMRALSIKIKTTWSQTKEKDRKAAGETEIGLLQRLVATKCGQLLCHMAHIRFVKA